MPTRKDIPTNSDLATKLEGFLPGLGSAFAEGVRRSREREAQFLDRQERRSSKGRLTFRGRRKAELSDEEIARGKNRIGARDD